MMKIRISHFSSSICLLVLSVILLLSPVFMMQLIQSDPSIQNAEDTSILIHLLFHIGCVTLLGMSLWEAKYYILTEQGISICLLGVAYRKVQWNNIFAITIGPDPFQKYTSQTLLLNCQQNKEYYLQNKIGSSMYEKDLYEDIFRGHVISLRCGKKLDSVLAMLRQYVSEDIVNQAQQI